MKKKLFTLFLCLCIMLSGCVQAFPKRDPVVQSSSESHLKRPNPLKTTTHIGDTRIVLTVIFVAGGVLIVGLTQID